jgi:hypothetical protein
MTYAIQKDMPIPPAAKGGRPSKYPLAAMDAGDSFVVPLSDASAKQIRQAVAAFSRRTGGKFVVRDIGGGTAVWKK